jgi:hypothetical protein
VTRWLATVALLAGVLAVSACEYVVLPPEPSSPAVDTSEGWTAVATSVEAVGSGDLRVELTIQNRTGAWSEMTAVPGRPASLTAADGSTSECATVIVGTGGHRLAPGFQMRAYFGGTKAEPAIELIRVECAGPVPSPGSKLAIDYRYRTGEYNYYDPDATLGDATLEVDLDQVAVGLEYPVAEPVEGLIQPPDIEITAINDVVLTLEGVERDGTSLVSSWQTANPGKYPTYVHIGEPPVIGSDGVVYGFYESPDLTSVPVTPAGGTAEWTTTVEVPADVTGLVMLLSVESRKQRLFVSYALDAEGS